jgi:hypothetical protein
MSALVAEELLAPLGSSTFDLQHLAQFERFEAGMGEIKRNRDGRDAGWRKPLVAQVAGGAESEAARREFVIELIYAGFELAAFNADAEIANAPGK